MPDQPSYRPAVNARWALVFVVLLAIFLLSPLANAIDVDPNWGGFYDDDDGDDVILLITGTMSAVEPLPPAEISHQPVMMGMVADTDPAESVPVSPPLHGSRSPPGPHSSHRA